MPTGIVIVNRHEPEHEVAARLFEIAAEKEYEARTVEAQRGEHDAALSFRVPQDVAEQFDADRASRWPSDKIENDDEMADGQGVAGVNEDAYAADSTRRANQARADNAARADEENTTTVPDRKTRTGKA